MEGGSGPSSTESRDAFLGIGFVSGLVAGAISTLLVLKFMDHMKARRAVAPSENSQSLGGRHFTPRNSSVSDNHDLSVVDLESPLQKIIYFLRRYENGIKKDMPAQSEAKMLRKLIEETNNLFAPDLQHQLREPGAYSDRVADYIVHHTTTQSARAFAMHPLSQLSVTDMDADDSSLKSKVPSVRPLLPVAYNVISDPNAKEYEVQSHRDIVVPKDVVHGISIDWFMDFVTPGGAMSQSECEEVLVAVVKQALVTLGISRQLTDEQQSTRVSILKLLSFTRRVENGYLGHGYHSRAHVADVTHRMACILHHSGIAQAAAASTRQCLQVLSALLAAVVHDFEHPQVTNDFLCTLDKPMALAFNYQAVCENHSLRTSLSLMDQDEYNFLQGNVVSESTRDVKRSIIDIVLGTDMSQHFEILGRFKTKVVMAANINGKSGRLAWLAMDADQHAITLQLAIKIADLGHCMSPFDQHKQWLRLLEEEMFVQGDEERKQGLTISPLMDRSKPGVSMPATQIGFFEVIVNPLLHLWVEVFPGCQALLTQTEANLAQWRAAHDVQMGLPSSMPHSLSVRRQSVPKHVII